MEIENYKHDKINITNGDFYYDHQVIIFIHNHTFFWGVNPHHHPGPLETSSCQKTIGKDEVSQTSNKEIKLYEFHLEPIVNDDNSFLFSDGHISLEIDRDKSCIFITRNRIKFILKKVNHETVSLDKNEIFGRKIVFYYFVVPPELKLAKKLNQNLFFLIGPLKNNHDSFRFFALFPNGKLSTFILEQFALDSSNWNIFIKVKIGVFRSLTKNDQGWRGNKKPKKIYGIQPFNNKDLYYTFNNESLEDIDENDLSRILNFFPPIAPNKYPFPYRFFEKDSLDSSDDSEEGGCS